MHSVAVLLRNLCDDEGGDPSQPMNGEGDPKSASIGSACASDSGRRECGNSSSRLGRVGNASLDSSELVSEHKGEPGAALTQLVAGLEKVSLDGLQPGDRDLVEQALLAARAALDRATSRDEPFPQED